MKKKFTLFALLLAWSSLTTAQPSAWQQKVDADLLNKTADGAAVDFLIVLRQQADLSAARFLTSKNEKATYVFEQLRHTAQRTQAPLIGILQHNSAAFQPLFVVNVIKATGNANLLQLLAEQPQVERIQDLPAVKLNGPVQTNQGTLRTVEWGIEKIRADSVWALGFRGQGVTIGGQDTGYDWQHPALKNQYRGFFPPDTIDHNYNWHDAIHQLNPLNADSIPSDPSNNPCGLDSPEPCDDHNHGTHTMGTMIGLNGDNQIGVAPQANWCGCRNMDRGWGTPFTYLECFQWFIAPTNLNNENPDPSKSPHVIANSWSCPEVEGCNPGNFAVMNLAVNNLQLAGTVVVVSAGNSGSNCSTINTPAAIFDNSFTVGATTISDTIAGFSSRGPVMVDSSGRIKPNICAPGVGVRSAIRNGEYASFSGTSMAGPHVAGVVALMISANPQLAGQVELIESILQQTAVPLITQQDCNGISGDDIPNNTYGHGRVDALAAVQ
ncbi:MAG TPA: peptidase S8, partial [Bacteroidetes bacterium]|nr:peptidase S8 [Bacteroidota bacterium]